MSAQPDEIMSAIDATCSRVEQKLDSSLKTFIYCIVGQTVVILASLDYAGERTAFTHYARDDK